MARSSATMAEKPAVSETNTVKEMPEETDSKKDFFWTYTEEPHRTRRMAIIKKYPQVRLLLSINFH